jgi:transposase-like protein
MNVQILTPVAGQDYPQNWNAFLEWFPTEEACLAYLEKLRWPDGFVCPACASAQPPGRASRGRLLCRACHHQASVTAGTIFSKTRTPLRVWLAAAWYVTNQKQGVSALGLQRVLGLGSYQTAWMMLHRFRRAMVRPHREPLQGVVEVDETYLEMSDRQPGGRAKRKSHTQRALVVLAVEIHEPRGFGRIRLRRVARDSQDQLIPFVQECVAPDARVCTDGSTAYLPLAELGYDHQRTIMVGSDTPAHASMPGVHRVAALIKRWLLGTHHGAVHPEQLDAFLDEFVFRFNRRSSRSRGLLFYRLLQQAVITGPLTYSQVAATRPRKAGQWS